MLVLSLRTDKPEAEIGLFEDGVQLDYQEWYAHRELSMTLLPRLAELLQTNGKTLQAVQGIAIYKGPGSFTGLRIGFAVANTLAYSLAAPIIAAQGDDWAALACAALEAGNNEQIALPFYGANAHITTQKH